jgi:hypothetical protein
MSMNNRVMSMRPADGGLVIEPARRREAARHAELQEGRQGFSRDGCRRHQHLGTMDMKKNADT